MHCLKYDQLSKFGFPIPASVVTIFGRGVEAFLHGLFSGSVDDAVLQVLPLFVGAAVSVALLRDDLKQVLMAFMSG